MAHSITLVSLLRTIWTCEARASPSGRAPGVVDFNEKRVPATLADSLADCELNSHDSELDRSVRRWLRLFADFFLFNVMALKCNDNSTVADS